MRFFLAALILALSSYSPALAQANNVTLEPLNLTVRYNIYWNGLPMGRLRIKTEETSSRYQVSFDIKTRGLAEMFSPLRSYTTASGIKNVRGDYIPTDYAAKTTDDGDTKTTTLTYDSSGTIIERDRNPPEVEGHRPIVPIEDLAEAHDGISAFLILRKTALDHLKNQQKETSVRVYDGRRLAEYTLRVVNPGTKMIHNQITGMINTVITRKPIDGYTEKELKKFDKGDPIVHLYFSQNGIFLPLALEAQVMFGIIRVEIDEESMPQLATQSK